MSLHWLVTSRARVYTAQCTRYTLHKGWSKKQTFSTSCTFFFRPPFTIINYIINNKHAKVHFSSFGFDKLINSPTRFLWAILRQTLEIHLWMGNWSESLCKVFTPIISHLHSNQFYLRGKISPFFLFNLKKTLFLCFCSGFAHAQIHCSQPLSDCPKGLCHSLCRSVVK